MLSWAKKINIPFVTAKITEVPQKCKLCIYYSKNKEEVENIFGGVADLPYCNHQRSYDEENTPLYVMGEEAPPERYCGIILDNNEAEKKLLHRRLLHTAGRMTEFYLNALFMSVEVFDKTSKMIERHKLSFTLLKHLVKEMAQDYKNLKNSSTP